jgi:hypothetical protein
MGTSGSFRKLQWSFTEVFPCASSSSLSPVWVTSTSMLRGKATTLSTQLRSSSTPARLPSSSWVVVNSSVTSMTSAPEGLVASTSNTATTGPFIMPDTAFQIDSVESAVCE